MISSPEFAIGLIATAGGLLALSISLAALRNVLAIPAWAPGIASFSGCLVTLAGGIALAMPLELVGDIELDLFTGLFLILLAVAGGAVTLLDLADGPGRQSQAAVGLILLGQLGVISGGHLPIAGWGLTVAGIWLSVLGGDDAEGPGFRFAVLGFTAVMSIAAGQLLLESPAQAAESIGIASALILAGYSAFLGLVPMHGWRLEMSTASRSRGAKVLIGIAVTNGAFYGLTRFCLADFPMAHDGHLILPPAWLPGLIISLGALTALRGIASAIVEVDLGRVLAGWTSHIAGVLAMAMGASIVTNGQRGVALDGLEFLLGAAHLALAGTALLLAGSMVTRDFSHHLDALSRRPKPRPWSAALFVLAAGSVLGLPPFGGFWLYRSTLHSLTMPAAGGLTQLFASGAAVALILSWAGAIACFVRLIASIVFGHRPDAGESDGDASLVARLAIGAPLAGSIAIALGTPATSDMLSPLFLVLVIAGFTSVGYALLRLLGGAERQAPAWRQGQQPTDETNITASSLAQPFIEVTTPLHSITETMPANEEADRRPGIIYERRVEPRGQAWWARQQRALSNWILRIESIQAPWANRPLGYVLATLALLLLVYSR